MTRNGDDDLMVVGTYGYRFEAEVGRSMLEASGIHALIVGDDAGGVQPALSASNGVRLLVRRHDERRAKSLLAG
jgi:hypothetical protein